MASKTEELEMEIYQQIRGLDKRQQTIIYENIRKIKFNMIQYDPIWKTPCHRQGGVFKAA